VQVHLAPDNSFCQFQSSNIFPNIKHIADGCFFQFHAILCGSLLTVTGACYNVLLVLAPNHFNFRSCQPFYA